MEKNFLLQLKELLTSFNKKEEKVVEEVIENTETETSLEETPIVEVEDTELEIVQETVAEEAPVEKPIDIQEQVIGLTETVANLLSRVETLEGGESEEAPVAEEESIENQFSKIEEENKELKLKLEEKEVKDEEPILNVDLSKTSETSFYDKMKNIRDNK